MNIPDKMFQTHSWLEICVFMFVKRNMNGSTIEVSLQRIADEFGTTRGKVRHIIDKFYLENLLIRTTSAQSPHKVRTTSAQANVDNQEVTGSFRTTSAQSPHKVRTTSAQQALKERAHSFGEKLVPFLEEYGKETIRKFYDYWTEAGEKDTRMRFEKETSFDIKRRLYRWRENNYEHNRTNNTPTLEDRLAKAARIMADD